MRATLLLLLALLLGAIQLASSQAYFDNRFTFPTSFGEPSCFQYDASNNVVYVVGSSSFYYNQQNFEEAYGVQIMRAVLDSDGGVISATYSCGPAPQSISHQIYNLSINSDHSGELWDAISGACLLSRDGAQLYVGMDGGTLAVFDTVTFEPLTWTNLGTYLPTTFVAGIAYVENGNNDELYVLTSVSPTLYRLDATTLTRYGSTESIPIIVPPYPSRMLLPILHDPIRGKVMFPVYGFGVVSGSAVNLLVFNEELGNFTVPSFEYVVVPNAPTTITGGVWDYRPAALISQEVNAPFSYWAIVNLLVVVDMENLTALTTTPLDYVSSLNYVPNNASHAWALASDDSVTAIFDVKLWTTEDPTLNLYQVSDQNSPCGGWAWDAIFVPPNAFVTSERYIYNAWGLQNGDTWDDSWKNSVICVVNTTADVYAGLPTTTLVTSTTHNAITQDMGAIIFEPYEIMYTCGKDYFIQWTFNVINASFTSNQTFLHNGACWELIRIDADTLVYHDEDYVYAVRISSWTRYAHNRPVFINSWASITWITYDSISKLIIATSDEQRFFFIDMSAPFVANTTAISGINLPIDFFNSQIAVLDPLNSAVYIVNCADTRNATIAEIALQPEVYIRSIRSVGNPANIPCLATGSYIDPNTHRLFAIDANPQSPLTTTFQNPSLVFSGSYAQPSASYCSAIDSARRTTYVVGRDSSSAFSLPKTTAWRQCWDGNNTPETIPSLILPANVRGYDYIDAQYDTESNIAFILVYDRDRNPTILSYFFNFTDCPLVNTVPPPQTTLPPAPPLTFPPAPTSLPSGTTGPGTSSTTGPINPGKKGLSGGTIAGIVILVIVVAGVIAALIFIYFTKYHRSHAPSVAPERGASAVSGAGTGDRAGHQRFHDEDSGRT